MIMGAGRLGARPEATMTTNGDDQRPRDTDDELAQQAETQSRSGARQATSSQQTAAEIARYVDQLTARAQREGGHDEAGTPPH